MHDDVVEEASRLLLNINQTNPPLLQDGLAISRQITHTKSQSPPQMHGKLGGGHPEESLSFPDILRENLEFKQRDITQKALATQTRSRPASFTGGGREGRVVGEEGGERFLPQQIV